MTGGLSGEEGHEGGGQAGAAPHNVVPGLAGPPHVVQQVLQPQLWQAV